MATRELSTVCKEFGASIPLQGFKLMTTARPLQPGAAIFLLQQHSLPSLVQHELERLILSGELLPGSRLTEGWVATRLGTSRGPVREALRSLQAKGLVRIEKNRGVFVRTIDAREADEIYEVRALLEERIARRLAEAHEPGCIAALEAMLAQMQTVAEHADVDRYHTLNLALHDHMAAHCGNAKLADTYRGLVNELALHRHQAHARGRSASTMLTSVAEHRAVVEAIARGDAQSAGASMRRHVEASRRRLQRVLEDAESAALRGTPGAGRVARP